MADKREYPGSAGRNSGYSDENRSRTGRSSYNKDEPPRTRPRAYNYEDEPPRTRPRAYDYEAEEARERRSKSSNRGSSGYSSSGYRSPGRSSSPRSSGQRSSRSGSADGDAPRGRAYDGQRSSNDRRPPDNRRRRRRRRRMPGWQKAIIIILLLAFLLMLLAVAMVWAKLSRIDRIDRGNELRTEENFEQDAEGEDTLSEEAVDFGEAQVNADEDVINILLIGRDARVDERGRSDSMIILSLNRKTSQISMVSLMRDSYVQIPGYSNNKLNAAYSFGGYQLMDETISLNYGIEIDYNVGVNFDGFEQVIDQLGGIDVTLTQAEAEYLMNDIDTKASGLSAGVNHLDGHTALGYARARYVSTGSESDDFGRTYRQRVVLQTVYQELMRKPLTDIWTIMDSIMDCVETDMTNPQIISIGTEVYNLGIANLQSYRLPQYGEYSDERINGMAVLVLDWDATRRNLQDWLYSDTPVEEHGVDAAN